MVRVADPDGFTEYVDQVDGQACPRCGRLSVVYSGNYYCLREDGTTCGWTMGREVPRIIVAYLHQCIADAVATGDQDTAQRMVFYLRQYEDVPVTHGVA